VFLRPNRRTRGPHTHEYWTLVESYRTARGSRQRVVAYLGDLNAVAREALQEQCRPEPPPQLPLFAEPQKPPVDTAEWVEVDIRRVRVERARAFGDVWLGLWVLRQLQLDQFLAKELPAGREAIPWAAMAQVLVLARLCEPSSELAVAERWFPRSALAELLGIPAAKVNDDRLYRALDRLLPAKDKLQKHLKERLGELFGLEYDLLLYDVTSTFFEGQAERNPQAQRGYSRDQRPDCKQVCIALVVSREGLPLGYEVFAGNRADVTTVTEIVEKIEEQYGQADRIWVMDRGMVSEENLEFMRQVGRRYLIGTPKQQLRRWQTELSADGWEQIREGLEVKLCPGPDGEETFILCRSAARREKEQAMRERAAARLEAGLQHLQEAAAKRPVPVEKLSERVGRLRERYSRASRLYEVTVTPQQEGGAALSWERRTQWTEWADLAEGCYVLRSNVKEWSAEELWRTYIQLTEAEAAFRIQKQDLSLRPVWHQTEERVQAHLLVCFLAYVLWKTLGRLCQGAGLGDCPRRVLEELGQLRLVDVILPTRGGHEIRKRCVTEPDAAQALLLQHLGLNLPKTFPATTMKDV
jgi:transposase